MAQEAKSWDPGSIPGLDSSFDVPESPCLLSGPGLQLDSGYTGSRGWFGGSSEMPSAGEVDSVTGTLKHVKSSVVRSVVSCCSGLPVMAQEAKSWDPGSIPSRDTSFDVPESSCLLSGPGLQLDSRYNNCKSLSLYLSLHLNLSPLPVSVSPILSLFLVSCIRLQSFCKLNKNQNKSNMYHKRCCMNQANRLRSSFQAPSEELGRTMRHSLFVKQQIYILITKSKVKETTSAPDQYQMNSGRRNKTKAQTWRFTWSNCDWAKRTLHFVRKKYHRVQ